ncbi:GTP-binding protein, partial [Staphylococcus epidermidis]
LAQYNQVACLLSQAGSSCSIHPVTYWVASMSRTQQESILEERPDVAKEWDIEYGDRHTQFVIIGTDIEKEEIVKSLDQCL